VLQRMVESLNDIASMERQPIMEGRRMNIILAPSGSKAKIKEEAKEAQNAETQNS